MICQKDYPKFMESRPDLTAVNKWSKDTVTWKMYCDGSATYLLSGAVAVAAVAVTI